jgi:hypothetical protein
MERHLSSNRRRCKEQVPDPKRVVVLLGQERHVEHRLHYIGEGPFDLQCHEPNQLAVGNHRRCELCALEAAQGTIRHARGTRHSISEDRKVHDVSIRGGIFTKLAGGHNVTATSSQEPPNVEFTPFYRGGNNDYTCSDIRRGGRRGDGGGAVLSMPLWKK